MNIIIKFVYGDTGKIKVTLRLDKYPNYKINQLIFFGNFSEVDSEVYVIEDIHHFIKNMTPKGIGNNYNQGMIIYIKPKQ